MMLNLIILKTIGVPIKLDQYSLQEFPKYLSRTNLVIDTGVPLL